jgi:multicomponent Na+:H+ antiporter subunit E
VPEETHEDPAAGDILVPVGESVTLRSTVAYAVREATETGGTVHFVAAVAWHDIGDVSAEQREALYDLLERVAVWAEGDADGAVGVEEDADGAVGVETAVVGADEYLFGPDDFARVLGGYARDHDVDRIVVDPEYSPGGNLPLLGPMESELSAAGFAVQEAPVERATRRGRLLRRGGGVQFLTLFGVSVLFYQLLAGFTATQFDLLTGALSGVVVAGMLHRITFAGRPRLRRLTRRGLRLAVYVPYLLYEIIKSNILVSYVILHPDLPIEPRLTEVRSAVWGGMPVATLANSITLTPGTLTVRVRGQDFVVHTLVPPAREGLFDGDLERAVRFVFYGRVSASISSPRERGDARILEGLSGGDEE